MEPVRRARACLAHKLGAVRSLDPDVFMLRLIYFFMKLYACHTGRALYGTQNGGAFDMRALGLCFLFK
ncbi:MAG: hypothetical protein ACLT4C_11495, partial [Butyricicoccus sp.]